MGKSKIADNSNEPVTAVYSAAGGDDIADDHALSRLEKGLAGSLVVDGPEQPDIFRAVAPSNGEKH